MSEIMTVESYSWSILDFTDGLLDKNKSPF